MPKKDKRVKGCIDDSCQAHIEKRKYKAEEEFCSKCGKPLVFVCAECHKQIEDEYSHRYCMLCEAQKKHHGGKIKHELKKFGDKAKANIASGAKKASQKVKHGALIVKNEAPHKFRQLREVAKNPKVRQAGAVLADAAVDKMKNPKVRKVAKDLVKVAKK